MCVRLCVVRYDVYLLVNVCYRENDKVVSTICENNYDVSTGQARGERDTGQRKIYHLSLVDFLPLHMGGIAM